MDLNLLRCFTVTAQELHFGRASRRLNILPSALSRNIRLLEEYLGLRLLNRTTRNVTLTNSGQVFLGQAQDVLSRFEEAVETTKNAAQIAERVFRVGAIDSASTGLLPQLIKDFREVEPEVELTLLEGKTVNMLPKLISGALDVAFVRPPIATRPSLNFEFLLNEQTIVALPSKHELVKKEEVSIADLFDVPMIVPSPRNRPHSYNVTMSLFTRNGRQPVIAQTADEKHTIVRLVGTGLGAALVPYWASRIQVDGVVYRPLLSVEGETIRELPLAAAWVERNHDPLILRLISLVKENLDTYSQ